MATSSVVPTAAAPIRSRGFVAPRFDDSGCAIANRDAEDLWRDGAACEARYEFDEARALFLAAARSAPVTRAAEFAGRYAAFLVERFGQYDEVARWLDDPQFGAAVDGGGFQTALLGLVARAAAEVGHARSATLDQTLAAAGEPDALDRTAARLEAAGDATTARALLERHAARLNPAAPATVRLAALRHADDERAAAALAPVEAALTARDAEAAATLLEGLRAPWHATAAFASLEARARRCAHEIAAATLREALERELDGENLDAALAHARTLAAAAAATDADRAWVGWIEDQLRRRDRGLRLSAVLAAPDAARRQRALVELAQAHGSDGEVPWGARGLPSDGASVLAREWSAVGEALAAVPDTAVDAVSARVAAVLVLREATAALDGVAVRASAAHGSTLAPGSFGAAAAADALRVAIAAFSCAPDRVPPTLAAARAALQRHENAQAHLEEQEHADAVAATVAAGDLDRAAAAIEAWTRSDPATGGQRPRRALTASIWKRLRADLAEARAVRERTTRLRHAFDAAVARSDVFDARRALGELVHLVPATERAALQARLSAAPGPSLRAQPTPPGLLKLQGSAMLCGVAHGRLVVAQDGLWLAVNLESGGLQPFALPQEWPLQAHPLARIGPRADRIRCHGFSRGYLLAIDCAPGQAPEVVAAVRLADVLHGDSVVLGAALEPDAAELGLLSRAHDRPGATTWTRLDANDFAVIEQRRTPLPCAGACGVAGSSDVLLAAAPRPGRSGWLVALADARAEPRAQLDFDDVGEPVASFQRAVAWPAHDRVYAAFDVLDPFDPAVTRAEPSLLVLKKDRVSFASSDLRRRFAPADRVAVDHPWTLDPAAGRLWFALVPTDGPAPREASLLGVDARTLRPDRPVRLDGVERVLALQAVVDGAVAFVRWHGGGYGLVRLRAASLAGESPLTTQRLPL
ncbi:MAG: hypothetical protein EXR79_05325 [Myxococcales bacterium]|nr:hypothetical protein [Myxococcales bacterium]